MRRPPAFVFLTLALAAGAEPLPDAAQSCSGCHGGDGASTQPDQWMNYLRMAFMHLRAGQRWMPQGMNARLDKLSDDDVEDLVNFYGSGAALHAAP